MVDKQRIQNAITEAEAKTTAEIHVHLCKHAAQEDILKEAQQIFSQYRLDNTIYRNAILLFIAIKSKRFAVLGDVAVHEKMGQFFWDQVRDAMAAEFRQGRETEAIVAGINLCSEYLQIHFPLKPGDKNHDICDDISEDNSSTS